MRRILLLRALRGTTRTCNNFGPRVGVAWAPERFKDRTVASRRLRHVLRTRAER